MVAEELGVPVERITVVEGDTALTPDQGGTGGSTGIALAWELQLLGQKAGAGA